MLSIQKVEKMKYKEIVCSFFVCFLSQGFFVALEPLLKLTLIDQADLELTEIHLPLPPEYWD